MTNNHYNKKLKSYAREHRNSSTKAEIRLWKKLLRNKQLLNYPFLRQRPIGNYIADFFCKDLKLVIEVDGLSHSFEEVIEQDKMKTQFLISAGYSVLRFTDNQVIDDIDNVQRAIEGWVRANHPPDPSKRGNSL